VYSIYFFFHPHTFYTLANLLRFASLWIPTVTWQRPSSLFSRFYPGHKLVTGDKWATRKKVVLEARDQLWMRRACHIQSHSCHLPDVIWQPRMELLCVHAVQNWAELVLPKKWEPYVIIRTFTGSTVKQRFLPFVVNIIFNTILRYEWAMARGKLPTSVFVCRWILLCLLTVQRNLYISKHWYFLDIL